ncbi:MAG TPA: gliding motility-associated C-terminal domain-containing protein [Cytophagaceae bacterium]|nr:gliding motility-associated C-terminal domain-containing protein [Cytophagaceae bacterium]
MKDRIILLILFLLLISRQSTQAMITVSGISTTTSTCGNNGTATINATSNKTDPSLMYELISGPATAPIQNNSTFASLFPGSYTVRIYDIDFVYKDASFTISGNYQLPALNPIAVNPMCAGFSDGSIKGNPVATSGKAPYSWQVIAPYTSAPQSSDLFTNLAASSYTIRMTDACGNFQTRTSILTAGSTGLSKWGDNTPSVLKTGCDTVVISQYFSIFKERAKIPVKLTITTSAGSYTKRVIPIARDTVNYTPGLYSIVDTVPNITYGNYLYLCITDTCGKSICASQYIVSPFKFELTYKVGTTCGNKMSADIRQVNPPYYSYLYTTFKKPATMTLTDVATNTVVDSLTCFDDYCTLQTKEQVSGRTYHLKIVDGCGQTFEQNILWPTPAQPRVDLSVNVGCMDSTAAAFFNIWNFKSNVKLEILSGPATVKSTKPHYTFSDQITYPKIFNVARQNGFALKNLSQGTYQYKIYDSCGNTVSGNIVVSASTLANFKYSYSIKKGCLGDNILYFDGTSPNTVAVYIRDAATNAILYQRRGGITPDSLTSLPPGKYVFQIYYGYYYVGGALYDGTLTDHNQDCWAVQDTITIPPYSNNTFKSNTTIYCNGTGYVQLNVDSTKGVPPYKYEIISGPQSFPLQASNIFQIPTYGDYVIRVQDACGNSNVRQISVDSAKFPPVIKKGASCAGGKITLSGVSSVYFKYQWKKPNGSSYYGDSLVINPLTTADTGVYTIIKTVTINGCSDSFQSTYHLFLNDVQTNIIPFCRGTSVQVGTHTYNTPGTYSDTLTNQLGCDSIIITKLISSYKKYPTSYTLCPGQQITVGTHTYTQAGVYNDTLISQSGCDSILVSTVIVSNYKRSISNRTICPGQTFSFAGKTLTISGTYYDTLTTTTCDSIATLVLTVASSPSVFLGKDTSLCTGHSMELDAGSGNAAYFWNNDYTSYTKQKISVNAAGKYWVLVYNASGCSALDTIEIKSIYPSPIVTVSSNKTICAGNIVTLNASGGLNYQWLPTGATGSSISVAPSTTSSYTVIAYDVHQCNSSPATVTVFVNPLPTRQPFANNQLKHCFDEGAVTLQPDWGISFFWTATGDTSRYFNAPQAGNYEVTVYDANGCDIKGSIAVMEDCPPVLFIPKAFSPNGDLQNDKLEIFGKHFINFEIKIFNRWGEIIFISNDRTIQWDGIYRGEEMPVGTYPWTISYEGENDGVERKLKGSVTLIR